MPSIHAAVLPRFVGPHLLHRGQRAQRFCILYELMCLTIFAYNWHPKLLLFLAFNRDEFLKRPTAPAHFWEQHPNVLAGKDLLRGGTWLGVTTDGRFSLLTNYREAGNLQLTSETRSRGELPLDFLVGRQPPLAYLQGLGSGFGGFNLVVGDLAAGEVAYWSNRGQDPPEVLGPGLYGSWLAGPHFGHCTAGVSNGLLQEWPKVQHTRAAVEQLLQQSDWEGEPQLPWEDLFQVMTNNTKVDDMSQLPLTGVGEDTDHYLSSAFIEATERFLEGHPYGTRSQTLLAVWQDGRLQLRERYVEYSSADADGMHWHSNQQEVQLTPRALEAIQNRKQPSATQAAAPGRPAPSQQRCAMG